jgi:hypothetical protein
MGHAAAQRSPQQGNSDAQLAERPPLRTVEVSSCRARPGAESSPGSALPAAPGGADGGGRAGAAPRITMAQALAMLEESDSYRYDPPSIAAEDAVRRNPAAPRGCVRSTRTESRSLPMAGTGHPK